jgi:hypothetical protein
MRKTLQTLLFGLSFWPIVLVAQTTNVTATVTDSDGFLWRNATWSAALYNPSGTQKPVYTKTGLPVQTSYNGAFNSSGVMSQALPDNNLISPAGTRWVFTLCSQTTAPCSNLSSIVITGASQSLSTFFNAGITVPRFADTSSAFGYGTVEVTTKNSGVTFYDVTAGACYIYNSTSWVPCGGTPEQPTYFVYTTAEFVTAWNAAYTYITAHGGGALIFLGPGNYDPTTPIIQPTIDGGGISMVGSNSTIRMNANNGGVPFTSLLSSPDGTKTIFSLHNIKFDCAPSANVNALYGINVPEIHDRNITWSNVQVSNCGTAALGGEDIKLGGNTHNTAVGITLQNINTDYNEFIYTGPDGGGGPTPPGANMHFSDNVADMIVDTFVGRNGTTCPLLIDGNNSGDIKVYNAHSFGFDGFGGQPQNYYQQWGICDYSTHFGGTYDSFINPVLDSVTKGGFDIRSLNVQIFNPLFYWPIGHTFATTDNMFTLESNSGTSFQVVITNPVCFQPPYAGVAPAFTNLTATPASPPSITGGQGCHTTNNTVGTWSTLSPIQIDTDSTPMALDIGTHANATLYGQYAGGRAMYGYFNGVGAVLQGSSSLNLCQNSTFGSGCFCQVTAAGGLVCGGNLGTTRTFTLDPTGIEGYKVSSIASASTIAPTTAVVQVTGTATITTITAPVSVCTLAGNSCQITLQSVNGFSLGTGGNISAAMSVPSGSKVTLTYVASSSQWIIPTTQLSGVSVSLGGSALAVNTCTNGAATVSGAAVGMVAISNPVTNPNTGTTQSFNWYANVTAPNTVTVYLCALAAGTPTATTFNVRVIP